MYRTYSTTTNITKEKDMNNSKFSQLVENAKMFNEDNVASIHINEQGVVIDAWMTDDAMALEMNVNLTTEQKRTLELKLSNFIKEVIEEQEEEHAVDAYDEVLDYYAQREHEERLIFA